MKPLFHVEHQNGMGLASKWCNRKVAPIGLNADEWTVIHCQEQNWLESLDGRKGITLSPVNKSDTNQSWVEEGNKLFPLSVIICPVT